MPALTFTADFTTGQLTITGHNLNTGDGAAGLFSAGGALPGGGALVEGSDYYIIKIDANTIKLADSNAHALAGTALSFTDNGSGTLLLLIGLPYRRPRTYANGSQLFSADLNSAFDGFTGHKRPPVRRNIPLTPTFIDTTNTWAQTGSGIKSTSITGSTIGSSYIDCPYEAGDEILGIEVWRKSDGTAGSKGCQLILSAAQSIIIATVSTDTILTGATTRAKLVVPASAGIGHVMAIGETLRFSFEGKTSTGYIIDCAQLVIMRP